MKIDVSPIPIEDKPVLRQLFELYRYDFSAFDDRDLSDHGWYDYGYLDNYWTENDRFPFMIRFEGKLAGFALVRRLLQNGEEVMSISEYFVLRKFRRQGIGEAAIQQIVKQFPGRWTLSINGANIEALAFWPKVLSRVTEGTAVARPSNRPGWVIHDFRVPSQSETNRAEGPNNLGPSPTDEPIPLTTSSQPSASIILLGGVAGSGKTTAARSLMYQTSSTWLQVDDLRLALQRSRVTMPEDDKTRALYFFEHHPNVWSQPADVLRDALVGVGRALSEAIAIVTANHAAQADAAIIEGDGILPEIVEHPDIRPLIEARRGTLAFILPDSRLEILERLAVRGRGTSAMSSSALERLTDMNWLYAHWLRNQAGHYGLPIVSPSPFSTLPERILMACNDSVHHGFPDTLSPPNGK